MPSFLTIFLMIELNRYVLMETASGSSIRVLILSSSHLLTAGYYSSAPRWGGSGNQISSARALPPDNTVAICLFQHANYQGRMLVLYGSNSHLPSLNFGDAISSIIITGGTWTLFEHSNYRGRSSRLVQGEYPDLHSFHIGGDSVSSVRRG